MFRAYFYKLLRSPLFYLAFAATLALSFYYYMTRGHDHINILEDLTSFISFQDYRKIFVIFAALPFTSNFADEWNSKTVVNCVTRKKSYNYAVTNIVMCYISAFAAVFLGLAVYVLMRSAEMPLFDPDNPFGGFAGVFENGAPMLGLLLMVFVFASSCGMWAVMGLTASAFFPSKYIAICAPFVFCYVIDKFTNNLPDIFKLGALSLSGSDMRPLPFFLWANFVFLAISAICGVIFTVRVKRRIENELS